MDRIENYSQIIRSILTPYTEINYANVEATNYALFDPETDQYMIVSVGWDDDRRVHGCLIHLAILDRKVWVQQDNTEDGVTYDLVAAGIPKSDIVLGFHEPQIRPHTGFGVG